MRAERAENGRGGSCESSGGGGSGGSCERGGSCRRGGNYGGCGNGGLCQSPWTLTKCGDASIDDCELYIANCWLFHCFYFQIF